MKAHRPAFLQTALVLVTSLVAFQATAQNPTQDPKIAAQVESLYKNAIVQMDAGNYGVACPSLAKAVALAPDAAIGARLKLAECYEKEGKLASAWKEYGQAAKAAQMAGQEERRKGAEARAAELRSKVAVLKIVVLAEQRNAAGLAVSVDGQEVASPAGVPVPVDRGSHSVKVAAAGYQPRTVRIQVDEDGAEVIAAVPALEPTVEASGTSHGVPHGQPSGLQRTPGAVSERAPVPASGPRSKVPGFVLGGVGVVAAIAGGALIGVAEGISSDIDTNVPRLPNGDSACAPDPLPGESAQCADFRSKADSGSAMGNAGIGLLVGGGVLVAGAVVYLLIPSKKTTASSPRVIPLVGQNGGGFVLSGSF